MPGLFRISARDHSALILMSDLASHYKRLPLRVRGTKGVTDQTKTNDSGSYVSLQDIADRMHLSQGYLEEIAGSLKKAGLITGKQGPAGGYRLARIPSKISLEDILVAVNGPLELVDCQGKNSLCPVAGKCPSKNVWAVLQTSIKKSLEETTLDKIK